MGDQEKLLGDKVTTTRQPGIFFERSEKIAGWLRDAARHQIKTVGRRNNG